MSDTQSIAVRHLQPGMRLELYVGHDLCTFEITEVSEIQTKTVTNLNFHVQHQVEARDVTVRNIDTDAIQELHPWCDSNFAILNDSLPMEE